MKAISFHSKGFRFSETFFVSINPKLSFISFLKQLYTLNLLYTYRERETWHITHTQTGISGYLSYLVFYFGLHGQAVFLDSFYIWHSFLC